MNIVSARCNSDPEYFIKYTGTKRNSNFSFQLDCLGHLSEAASSYQVNWWSWFTITYSARQ